MQISQVHLKGDLDDQSIAKLSAIKPTVLYAFGDAKYFADGTLGKKLNSAFPNTVVVGCSTAGEIVDTYVHESTLVLTAVNDGSEYAMATTELEDMQHSREAGRRLGKQLASTKPKMVFVVAPGLNINGSELVEGLITELGDKVLVTGGLAGDGTRFGTTYTMSNKTISTRQVVAIAMHKGPASVSSGVEGGWHPFGPYRQVTRAENNILYELDGKSALQLYREYLGDRAKDLPGSGLLYPLDVISKGRDDTDSIVRSILDINDEKGSIMLAGDVHVGDMVRLMHAKTENLVAGAKSAAEYAVKSTPSSDKPSLGILVSCIGRRIVMGDDVDDEVGSVKEVFGPNAVITGFYSYGEICPPKVGKPSRLHNQTMTITRIAHTAHDG